MDYEKKYKALVEAVKTLKETNPFDEGIQNWVNDNVPELKESEDEKIRKELLNAFHESEESLYMVLTPHKRESFIAWLEKQGKWQYPTTYNQVETATTTIEGLQKQDKKIDAIEDFDTEFERQVSCLIASAINREYEYNQGYVKWVANALLEYAKHELEKQGEQEPAEWRREDEQNLNACFGYIPDEFLRRWLTDIIHVKYDKPAEKKELKKIEQNSIEPDDLIEESYQQQADDLIDMVTEKTAWSEEDKRHIELLISICEEEQEIYQTDSLPYINIGEAINWLKSLKDKYTWKPSDEQMKALDIAIRCGIQLGTWEEDALKSLKEQLKKLREE